jgi:hypothetical protein
MANASNNFDTFTIEAFMHSLLRLLSLSRQSGRLIQSVALAFVLSLGVAIAAPALQAQNQSPDTQVICLGQGGMKTVTFAADGTATEVQTAHGQQCLLCGALLALPHASQSRSSLQTMRFAQPLLAVAPRTTAFEYRTPPSRAPPTSKN